MTIIIVKQNILFLLKKKKKAKYFIKKKKKEAKYSFILFIKISVCFRLTCIRAFEIGPQPSSNHVLNSDSDIGPPKAKLIFNSIPISGIQSSNLIYFFNSGLD